VTPCNRPVFFQKLFLTANLLLPFAALAQPAPQIFQVTSPQLWQRAEFRITNVPQASNPFDPNVIALDATFTLPSGRAVTVPAFWFQDYVRDLSGGYEYETATGSPEWRLRFSPPEPGNYSLSVTIKTNSQVYGTPLTTIFTVPTVATQNQSGYVRVGANHQYFETGDGQALRLNGENVDWMTTGLGTYQYDTWFSNMAAVGENYARLMSTPWSFNLETDSNSLNNYHLDAAWKLDYVLQLAEQRGLYVLLCLDVHEMFQPVPDVWGIDFWPTNPYNAANGGPCTNQDAFFTNPTARAIYQKRLRYLVARYGYSQKLVAWELLSEIDNEYAWLNPPDVAVWHGVMGDWLHANDPYGHLVTTSLWVVKNRPEIWSLPEIDFVTYHCYGEPSPATSINADVQPFHQQYNKPVLIDEFGTSSSDWGRTNDLYLRGFRQGLWGGALGGSVGTAMSWWWDSIDAESDYSDYAALGAILNHTGWGCGTWTNINFPASSSSPPSTVGNVIPGGQPFNVVVVPSGVWAPPLSGRLPVPNSQAASEAGAALDGFLLGAWFPTLSIPFALDAWLTNNARVVIHINSVSDSAAMAVRVDGSQVFSTNLPNLNGAGNNVINESYNLDVPINLPAGKHLIELTNTANGWVYLDWVRLEQVLPSTYASNWVPSPSAIGLQGPHESLVYAIAPGASFSGVDTNAVLPLQQSNVVVMSNWPAGKFFAEWYDPATGTNAGYTQATTTNGILTLPLPNYSADLAGIVYPPPTLTTLGMDGSGAFNFQLNSETGGIYAIEQSPNLSNWTAFSTVTNVTGVLTLTNPAAKVHVKTFFQARRSQ
jgi:hypothetical protein